MKIIDLYNKKQSNNFIKENNINYLKKTYNITNINISSSNTFINNYNSYLKESNSHLETDLHIRKLVDISTRIPFFNNNIDKSNLKDFNLKKWECSVCLLKMNNINLVIKTECNHYFCIYCIFQLFKLNLTKTNCPMCRHKLKNESISFIKKKTIFNYGNIIKQMIKYNYQLSLDIFGEKTIYLIKNSNLYKHSIFMSFNKKNNHWNQFMNKIYNKQVFYNISNIHNIYNIHNFNNMLNSNPKKIIVLKIILNNDEIKHLEKTLIIFKNTYNFDYIKTSFLLLKKTIEEKVYNEEVIFN